MQVPDSVAYVCPACKSPAQLRDHGRTLIAELVHLYCTPCDTHIKLTIRRRFVPAERPAEPRILDTRRLS